ncbi:ArsR/SmtB family transcription factor [Tessaracoccus sp. G1721]
MVESTVVELSLREDRAVAVLQAVADPVRWRVLSRLSSATQCVCDLQAAIDIAPNLLSYHLKVLREAGLIVGTRRGRWIDYTLADGAAALVRSALPGELRG